MSSEEWCTDKLSKLLNDDDRMSVLQEMKDFFNSIPQDEMLRTADTLQLPLVFDCLNNSDTEQVDLACDVLSLCMANLNLGESTNRYGVFIERALNHPYPAVKLMALTEIKRNLDNEPALVALCKRESLLNSVVRCMADADLGVATKAADVITTVGISQSGILQLTADAVVKVIVDTMGSSEIVRLRIYEVIINISVKSEVSFNHLKSMGLPTLVLNELDNNDLLLRLNIIELLIQLSQPDYGYNYLESNEVITKLSKSLDSDDLISTRLIEPGILKFLGHIAHHKPIEVFSKFPHLIERLFNNLEGTDYTITGVSVDTIGHIGIRSNGKIALESTNRMESTIKIIATSTSFPTDIKVRALTCLEHLLGVVDNDEDDVSITTITRKWYNFIDDKPIDVILNYAKNPFGEFRLAGFGVLTSIARQLWGQEVIRDTPGLVEFLLDRNIETMKECKEAKYNIVVVLSKSAVFEQFTSKQLQAFVKEGPFYVQPVTVVAIEGNE